MSKQKCIHCGYEWNYVGIYRVKTTCPDCQRRTPINRTKEELELIKEIKKIKEKEEEVTEV